MKKKRTSKKRTSKKAKRTSRAGRPRRVTRRPLRRRLVANVNPGMPSSPTDWTQWIKVTYAPGTPVRVGPWIPPGKNGAPATGIPRGTVGEVKSVSADGTTLNIDFTVIGAPGFISQGTVDIVSVPLRIDYGTDVTIWLDPLVDNWASTQPKVRRMSPPPTQGWAKQLRASRSYRAQKPNPRPQGRGCAACGKPLGCIAIDGAYWHPPCFRKASPEKRGAARRALHREQQEEIAASERRRAERTSKRRYTSGR